MSPSDPSLRSSSSRTPLLPCCSLPPVQSTSPSLLCRPLPLHLLLPPSPRVAWTSAATLALPCCPISRVPRPPRASAGHHLAAAVESSLQNPRALSFARISTTRAPATHSPGSFAVSPTLDPDHHRPLLPSVEILVTVDSHPRPPIAPIDPLASFLHPCSCSLAPKRRRILAGAPLPTTAARRRLRLTVEHPFLTLLASN
jgi:hypothetical protein